MGAHQQRQVLLLLAGKTGHIGIRQQVGAMSVVLSVGDTQPDFMQLRRPEQCIPVGIVKAPALAYLVEQGFGSCCHLVGLLPVHIVTQRNICHGRLAYVLVLAPADQLVDNAFAQGAVGYLDMLQVQRLDNGAEDGDPSRKDRFAAIRQSLQVQLVMVARGNQPLAQDFDGIPGDAFLAPTLGHGNVGDGADGSR